MMGNLRFYVLSGTLIFSNSALAVENTTVSPSTGLLQIASALMVVIALVFVAAWVMRRLGPLNTANKISVKLIGGINVGNRERVMVVEVADQWLVLGVTASNINHLASLPKQENLLTQSAHPVANDPFSTWLKRTLDKSSTERSDNS